MTTTPKFGIPLISSQQNQPEVTHNQMVLLFQAVLGGAIAKQNAPPGSPADGDSYVVDTAGSGAWSGHDNAIAIFFGGWNFIPGVDDDGVTIAMGAAQTGLSISIAGSPFAWSGTAWTASGGGGDVGTPPSIVQVAADVSGTNSITLGAAPTSGNLLVCIAANANSAGTGAGWTQVAAQSSGLDYGMVYTKVAGVGESATQSPGSGFGGGGGMVVWELYSPSGTPKYITGASQAEQATGTVGSGPAQPSLKDCIGLSSICLASSSNSIDTAFNCTEDAAVRVGTARQVIGGHSFSTTALTQMIASFTGSGSPNYKGGAAVISKG